MVKNNETKSTPKFSIKNAQNLVGKLEKEKSKLDEMTVKLGAFNVTATKETVIGGHKMVQLLKKQQKLMDEYSSVLGARIELVKKFYEV